MKNTQLRKIIKEEISNALKYRPHTPSQSNKLDEEDGSDITNPLFNDTSTNINDEEIATIIEDALDTIYDLGGELDTRELLKMFDRELSSRSGEGYEPIN